jgi:hypothetical protein
MPPHHRSAPRYRRLARAFQPTRWSLPCLARAYQLLAPVRHVPATPFAATGAADDAHTKKLIKGYAI